MQSFNGWSTEDIKDFKGFFEESYNDDGELVLVSKETFHHDEPESDLVFDYKFVVQAMDLYGMGGDNKEISICLYMCPLPKFWNEKALIDAAELFGLEDEPIDKLPDMLYPQDWLASYCCIPFGSELIQYNNDDAYYDVLDNVDVVETINVIASIVPCINSMRGFSLDRNWNALGSTGWDILHHCINGDDLFNPAFVRAGY